MQFQLFSGSSLSLLSIISGMIFGFLLRKATVSRFDTIIRQLLLKDFTVMQVILTAIATTSCGSLLLSYIGLAPPLDLSSIPVIGTLVGGAIFGIGMSITGYCPGTAIAAIAEGSKDMISGFVGMLVGSVIFNELYPYLEPLLTTKDATYKQTIASYFGISSEVVVVSLLSVWGVFFLSIQKLEQVRKNKPSARSAT